MMSKILLFLFLLILKKYVAESINDSNDNYDFNCGSTGIFDNPHDLECRSYYVCHKLVSSYTNQYLICPRGTLFDPLFRFCSPFYTCQRSRDIDVVKTKYNTTSISSTSNSAGKRCIYIAETTHFICVTRGRYPNLNDPTCQTYYLCNLLENGSYVQTLYKCPQTSFFNAPVQVCDVNYQCPCTVSTSTTILSTITEEPSTSPRDETRTTASFTSEVSTTSSTTTVGETCTYIADTSYFTCSSEGRYPNLNDPTCQTYYLCNLLKNGSYVQTLYKCPQTSFFNAPVQVCDVNYQCPCTVSTSTTILSTITEEPSKSPRDETRTTASFTSEVSTTSSTTTVGETCTYIADTSYFTCSSEGRYPNLNDPTCQTYYLCNLLKNGSYVQTLYKCPSTSFFNAPVQVCDINYQCPCTVSTSTTIQSTITEEPSTSPRDETRTTASFTSEDSTTSSTTTVGETCTYIADTSYFTCSSEGRYPNLNDPTCQTYYLCNLLKNGSYVQTLYKCPSTSFFNAPVQVCDINYQCPCTVFTSTTILSTITEEPSTSPRDKTSTTASFTSEVSTTLSTTAARETCTYIADTSYFTCSNEGRYPNLNDLTCQTYYLCNLLKNGSYVQTLYKCPSTSFFNAPVQVCDVNYQCPCTVSTSTTILSTITEEPSTSPRDETRTTASFTSEVSTTSSTTTVGETCTYIADTSYFTCSSEGRYPNLNDPTCQTYYLCNLLKNGSYVQTLYKCPSTSFFNAPVQVCDVNYQCPCTVSTSTTILSTITEEPSTSPRDETRTTASFTGEVSTTSSTTTVGETCTYIADTSYFTCSSEGRYPNLNDPSCQTYYLCNLLKNGSYVQTLYKCPSTSFFNAPVQVCDINYQCPCTVSTSTTILSTITEEPSTSPRDKTSTTASFTSEVSTTLSTTAARETCTYIADTSYFTCSNEGRYPNLNDLTCQTYYLCNLLKNGSYVQTLYKCPSTSFFNAPVQVCDVNYQCPCTVSTSTTILSTITEEPSTSPRDETRTTASFTSEVSTTSSTTTVGETCTYIADTSYFTCSSEGRYPNLNDPTCQTYYLCNLLKNGSYVQTLYKCPSTSFFNAPVQVCDVNYQCPCTVSTSTTILSTITEEPSTSPRDETRTTASFTSEVSTTSSTTTVGETCTYIADTSYFTCSSEGRYPNLNDPSCQTYYLCNLLKNGSYVQTLYKCPSTSFFNAPVQVCDVNYQCPCTVSTSTTIQSTITEEPSTSPRDETRTTASFTSEVSTTSYTTTVGETCTYIADISYFTCSSEGRYPNLNDPTCQTYYLCNLLKNGSYVQTLYKCPQTSFFNAPVQVCDINYQCPCTVSTSTTILSTITEEPSTSPRDETRTTASFTSEVSTTSSTTTVGETCTYIADISYFTCTSEGRYPNLNDPTCQTYYLCNLLKNGSYVQTLYKCPQTSFFNAPVQVCDINYQCPCTVSTSTTILSTITEEPSTSPRDETRTTASFTSEVSTTSSTTTVGETCTYIADISYFTCTSEGRYLNLNDPTCQTYYLCNLLKNGSYVQTLYKCPPTSFFNAPVQVCDINYQCPCTVSTSTTILSTITEEPSTSPRDKTSTAASFTSEVSTTLSTTAARETCTYIADTSYFTCSNEGRYPNLNDLTCQTYYLCNLLKNGSYVQTLYKCPSTSFFNAPVQVCDVNYQCPCTVSTSTTILSTITEEPLTSPRDETRTTASFTSEVSTTLSTTTVGETCTYIANTSYFTCSSEGRYPNLNDPTCQTYYLCNLLKNGSYVQTLYKCPQTSFFNAPVQVCDVNYQCPCTVSTSTTILSTITEEPSTSPRDRTRTTASFTSEVSTTSSTTTLGETCTYIANTSYFTCSSEGRYPNLNDPTCQTYYLCNRLKNDSYVQTLDKCPQTSFFNAPVQVCDINYQCPCTVSTSTTILSTITEESSTSPRDDTRTTASFTSEVSTTLSTTTARETCTYIADTSYFTCRSEGRYPNLNDPTCQTYYLCNLLKNGSYVQTLYKCPQTSFFNAPVQICDVNYQCPCTVSTCTTILSTITEEPLTSPRDETRTTASFTSEVSTTLSTTTVGETCTYIADTSYFTCSIEGRYPNLNDPTCQTYYLCNLLKNGSYVQTLHKCPQTSFFNAPVQVCDVNYQCPCTVSTSTTILSTITEEPSTSPRDGTRTTASFTSEVSTTLSTTTVGETCTYIANTSYFTCSSEGRYPNLNDPTCQTYYLCNLLKNGSYVQTLYKCPQTSFFNAPVQVCDINYQCPCTVSTSTTILSTITEESSTSPRDDTRTTASFTSEVSTTLSTTTARETCTYIADTSYFTCSSKGRYPNLNDLTCQTYYLCNLLKNGSFVQTLYKCPPTSFFNAPEEVCDNNYECPCTVSTSTTILSTITEEPSTSPKDETRTTASFTSEVSTTLSTTTVGETCTYVADTSYFTCSSEGRYPNLNDPTCQTYYLCNLLKNGSFVQTLYKCPQTSFFNAPVQVCDVNYQCPCTVSTSTTILSTITEEPSTSPRDDTSTTASFTSEVSKTSSTTTVGETCTYIADTSYFTCSSKGRYPNLNDLTCQTYYLCNLLKNGSYVQTLYKCPQTSFFNAPVQVCDVNYQCPCTVSTSTTILSTITEEPSISPRDETRTTASFTSEISTTLFTTTVGETCTYIADTSYFTCSSEGRYPNLNDPTCQTYYLCNLLKNGSYVQTLYKCPQTSFFNAPVQVCDVNYQCPCTVSTSTTILSTITEEPSTSPRDDTSTTASFTSEVSKTSSTTTVGETCTYIADTSYFTCSSIGRYPNLNDLTCQTYYLCNLLKNGSFVQTLYKCPPTSFFNASEEVCDINYHCPCTEKSMTTEIREVTTEEQIRITENSREAVSTTMTSFTSAFEACVYVSNPSHFTCSLNYPTCQIYYICNLIRNVTLIQNLYRCPEMTAFNSSAHACDVFYECPCGYATRTEAQNNMTEESGAVNEITDGKISEDNDSSSFFCPASGIYEDIDDLKCQHFYICIRFISSYISIYSKCPRGTFYDPMFRLCTPDYFCPHYSKSTTENIESTSLSSSSALYTIKTTENYAATDVVTESSTTESNIFYSDFFCPSTGIFEDPEDIGCKHFYICVRSSISYLSIHVACPEGTLFDPLFRSCSPFSSCTHSPEQTTDHFQKTIITEKEQFSTENRLSTEAVSPPDRCLYNEDIAYFTCITEGRHPNLNDPLCRSYFKCDSQRDSSFVQTLHECPSISIFNPQLQMCDIDYVCPCSSNTKSIANEITEPSNTDENISDYVFTCSSSGIFEDVTDSRCEHFYVCIRTLLSYITIRSICPSGTFFDPFFRSCSAFYSCPHLSTPSTTVSPRPLYRCTEVKESEDFSCSTDGKYPNLNDVSCRTYYFCNMLKNGSFVQTYNECLENTYFNPASHLCEVNYVCPCNEAITVSTKSGIETTMSMTPADGIDNSGFICASTGIFEDVRDSRCEHFYVCIRSLLSYISIYATCPEGTSFDPLLRLCSPLYSCPHPTRMKDDIHEVTATEGISPHIGQLPTESSAYTFITDQCVFFNDPAYLSCSIQGRYTNLNDFTCRTYYSCDLQENGSFVRTLHECPITLNFNPQSQECDVNYKCPCTSTTRTIHTTGISEQQKNEITMSTTSVERNNWFVCPSTGIFEDIEDMNCKKFYICSRSFLAYTSLHLTCPLGTYFDPSLSLCNPLYSCPRSLDSYTSVTQLTSPTPYSSPYHCGGNSVNFRCSSVGRYPNSNDSTCRSYYLCSLKEVGIYSKNIYQCPEFLHFNPILRICDFSYICPCDITKNRAVRSIDTKELVGGNAITSTVKNEQIERKMNLTLLSTSRRECVNKENAQPFSCINRGRYANWNDSSCQTYYLCVLLRRGSFVKTLYKCPRGSYFNPMKQVCDLNYECLCSITKSRLRRSIAGNKAGINEAIQITKKQQSEMTVCAYSADSPTFTCNSRGRYPNRNDPTCRKYYLCVPLRSGSFTQGSYICPRGSFFNPKKQVCDMDYKCHCSNKNN